MIFRAYIAETILAVENLHSYGIIQLDIKPAIIIQHHNGFISSFAEYITAFYLEREKEGQAANMALPTEAQINETFTQQVTYARVKLQRSAALIESTPLPISKDLHPTA